MMFDYSKTDKQTSMFDWFFVYVLITFFHRHLTPLLLFLPLSFDRILAPIWPLEPAPTHMANFAEGKSTSMATKFGEDRKYRSARRKGDDSKPTKVIGVIKMLKNVRIRLYLATTIAALPFLVSFALYVSSFSFFGQFVIGFLCGLCVEFAYLLLNLHRNHVRQRLNVQVAQMSHLDAHKLRVLLPAEELFAKVLRISDFEKVEWLNKTMKKFWPYIDQAAGEVIKGILQPILDSYEMGMIQRIFLQTVAFGSNAPHITGVRVIPGEIDECVLEIQILWRTEKEGVNLMIEVPGPDYEVKAKNLHLQGTAKLVFKPLTETIPGFGAVLLSLNEPPGFNFDMTFLGANIRYLPGVEKMFDNSIRTALMDSMVWPNRIVVPMIPGADFSFLKLHPVGELKVQLVEAKDIYWSHAVKTDVFVKMFVHQTQDKTKCSITKRNTRQPVWNETFTLQVEYPETQKLSLLLMHSGSCEIIGSVELPITEFQSGVQINRWCDIFKDFQHGRSDQICKKLQTGKLHICVTYSPFGREKILAMRGGNETEKKLHENHQNLESECHLRSK